MSQFFWGEVEGQPKKHRRKWSGLCFPTEQNGLGIHTLDDVLKAFSCQLWWKLRTSDNFGRAI